jgi:hypothetical protein
MWGFLKLLPPSDVLALPTSTVLPSSALYFAVLRLAGAPEESVEVFSPVEAQLANKTARAQKPRAAVERTAGRIVFMGIVGERLQLLVFVAGTGEQKRDPRRVPACFRANQPAAYPPICPGTSGNSYA